MKKRFFCLFLCLITVLSVVLTSCSSKSDEDIENNLQEEASEAAITLAMWVVSEGEVSESTAAAVEKALNTITESKFKTHLDITYLTEDKYRSELEKAIAEFSKTQEAVTEAPEEEESETESGETGKKDDDETEITDETEVNDIGMSVIKYPEVLKNQVDIIYITGEDMYIDFIENDWLAKLDGELSSSSKKIKEYVSGTLLEAVKYGEEIYAIPNNRTIGEYKYMLMNKELMDKYKMDSCIATDKINSFYNEYVYSFLEVVAKNEPNTIPIDSNYEECLEMLAHYWMIDPETYGTLNEFSIFGYHYTDIEELNRGSVALGYNSLFEDAKFTTDYLKLNKYRLDTERTYFGDAAAEGKSSAIRFVNGDYSLYGEFEKKGYCVYEDEEYYLVPVAYPRASATDIYGHMFGVSNYTLSLSRSMQIVTYLNTNSAFRNILQYGVEGTHYKLNQDDQTKKITVERLTNDYMMNIYATGNAFIAYPDPALKMSDDIWESGKIQNRVSQVDPLMGFNFAEYAASMSQKKESVSLGKVGYNVSYETGFSKDVFAQDAALGAWFTQCDQAGKGVYVLNTSEISGNNLTAYYYVYNNSLTNNTTFTVEDLRETEIRVNNKGKEEEVQTNLDFILTYTDAEGASETGYELSIVKLYTRKTNEFEILCKVNDAETGIQQTAQDALLKFDYMDTKQYKIELYEGLTKAALRNNAIVTEWINDCDKEGVKDGEPKTFIYKYETPSTAEVKQTTYIFYRTGLNYLTDMSFIPTGPTGSLKLDIGFISNYEEPLDLKQTESKIPDQNYVIYYVRITEKEDIDISYSLINSELIKLEDGTEIDVLAADTTAKVFNEKDDPDFEMLGNLDTELVKFMYKLNNEIVAFLEACTTYDELETLVKDLRYLLSTGTAVPQYRTRDIDTDALRQLLEEQYDESGKRLVNFHHKIQSICSAELVEYSGSECYVDLNNRTEPYVYFDSPYMVYYAWMSEFGYLPAETSTEK